MKDPIKTYPMAERHNLVHLKDFGRFDCGFFSATAFIDSLPNIHAGITIKKIISALIKSRKSSRPVILGMGAHVIKCGLAPYLIKLMEASAITAISMNGAAAIHDFELAYFGETSEDVSKELHAGRFGFVEETGAWMSAAIKKGAKQGLGLGACLGNDIQESPERFPFRSSSVLWHAARCKIPCTVHVAIGTDFVHLHPDIDGETLGSTTFKDFMLFCQEVEKLENGVYWNLGSAVIMPEVFLKAISRSYNLGHSLTGMTTIDMDMISHYRPATNVVKRPSLGAGQGFHLTGHHEIMFPLVSLAFLEGLK